MEQRDMRLLVVGVPLVIGLWTSGAASAAYLNGNTLLKDCEDSASPIAVIACVSYVMGVADVISADIVGRSRSVCIPAGVTAEQLTRTVKKHLNDNPATLHYEAWALVNNALAKDYRCRSHQQRTP